MNENKFFEKFLENLSRVDESSLKLHIESLENERRTFRQILDSLDESLFVIQDRKIIFLNQQALKMLSVTSMKTPVSLEEVRKNIPNPEFMDFIVVTLFDEDYSTEFSTGFNDKRYYRMEKSSAENGFHIIKIHDVTERLLLQSQLKNLESISALNTLAAGIAHEIKNPLTAIDLHTQIIKKGIDKKIIDVPEEVVTYIQIIDEEQKRLGKIVQDFLTAARKRELKVTFEDFNVFLQDILKLIEPEINLHCIDLVTDWGSVPRLFFDRDYLKQAVLNLLKNGIEAMQDPECRKKELKILKIQTFYDMASDSVALTISDTGTGIEPERIQKVFEPYYTTKDTGTGLGLTIVYKIIKEHSGEIRVESKIGEGTSFTVYLPLNKGPRLIT